MPPQPPEFPEIRPMADMLPFHVYDVFTDRPYAGNPLAIVEGADGLDGAQMQAMARQFNLSETIFVMRPDDPAHAARVRIFFPTAEIPFAGHPTLGCALHLFSTRAAEGETEAKIVLEEPAGLVPVRVDAQDGGLEGIFAAPVLPAPHPGEAPPDLVAEALGLAADDVGLPGHAPALRAGGPAFLFVPVRDLSALGRARPAEPAWSRLMEAGDVGAAWLYTPETAPEADWRARLFAPGAGIPEDPATGSATAIFAGQLREAGALGDGTTRVVVRQGVEMGRPARLVLEADMAGGDLAAVRVGGAAVKVAEGRIAPPPA